MSIFHKPGNNKNRGRNISKTDYFCFHSNLKFLRTRMKYQDTKNILNSLFKAYDSWFYDDHDIVLTMYFLFCWQVSISKLHYSTYGLYLIIKWHCDFHSQSFILVAAVHNDDDVYYEYQGIIIFYDIKIWFVIISIVSCFLLKHWYLYFPGVPTGYSTLPLS